MTRLCGTCKFAHRPNWYVERCSLKAEGDPETYNRVVTAAISEQCADYCPVEPQKRGKFSVKRVGSGKVPPNTTKAIRSQI